MRSDKCYIERVFHEVKLRWNIGTLLSQRGKDIHLFDFDFFVFTGPNVSLSRLQRLRSEDYGWSQEG